MKCYALAFALFLAANYAARPQGSFKNLDFEASSVPQNPQTNVVSSLDGLPGWLAYASTNQLDLIGFNQARLSATCVSLLGTNGEQTFGYRALDGGFSVLLQGGTSGSGPNLYPTAASISQTGLIPATSHSLQFLAQHNSGVLSLFLGGTSIPYVELLNTPNYSLFGADVSAFAGQTADLVFSVSRLPGTAQGRWDLDSIHFSDLAIPEPHVMPLVLLGVATLWARHWRQK